MAKFSCKVGELKHPIFIGHKENITQDNVIIGERYVKDFRLHAKVNKESVYQEVNSAYQENYIETCTFTVRYTDKVSYDNVVLFADKVWRIVDIDNVQFSNKWLKIRTKFIANDLEEVEF